MLAYGAHGLANSRVLFEFYRLDSGNCKISCRTRVTDPAFDMLCEAAVELPQKQGGMNLNSETESIFVEPIGKVPEGSEDDAINQFITRFQGSSKYREFFENLKLSLEQTSK